MPSIIAFIVFDLLGVVFLLWCLLNFVREDRRYRRSNVKVMHIDPMLRHISAKVVPMDRTRSGWQKRRSARLALMLLLAFAVTPAAHAQGTNAMDSDHREIEELRQLVRELRDRVAALEARDSTPPTNVPPISSVAATDTKTQAAAAPLSDADRTTLDFLRGTTINFALDGYYGYNFNRPVGRVNLLRAYDVMSDSFSLNQASVVVERTPDVAGGRRWGGRLDLQFGQATETLQGSAANELRPQAYRAIFQAYGTYVAPIGSGLTIDFGKWGSSLGIENNYTKDQINYSRSYFFDFLPFYHMGARATYTFAPWLTATYALVNGVQQTEDFNGAKSQMVFLNFKPVKSVSWNVNYYTGQEQRDALPVLNPGLPIGPTQPGLPVVPIVPWPDGRMHIVDSYVTWTATPKWTLALEGDYVINRQSNESGPSHVSGGAAYARYQVTPKTALAGRAEYLSDRGGLFSGKTQALKETTLTYEYKFAEGFLARAEWRRDFSNQPFFLTEAVGALKKEQNTATLGLVWWFGQKQGAW